MTVETTDRRINYIANGVADLFNFNFKTSDPNSIFVYEDGILSTAIITVVLSPDQDNTPGGNVTVNPIPLNGVVVSVIRTESLNQNLDYITGDEFPVESHEGALDKLTKIDQQQQDDLNRAVKADINDDGTTDFTVPNYDSGKALMWDPVQKRIINSTNNINNTPAVGLPSIIAGDAGKSIVVNAAEDNYELSQQGTFLPQLFDSTLDGLLGQTYSLQNGQFYREGDKVSFSMEIVMSSLGSLVGSSQVFLSPLPATNSLVEHYYSVGYLSVNINGTGAVLARLAGGTSRLDLWRMTSTGRTPITIAELAQNALLNVTGFYFV